MIKYADVEGHEQFGHETEEIDRVLVLVADEDNEEGVVDIDEPLILDGHYNIRHH